MNRIRTLSPVVVAILALVSVISPAALAQKQDSESSNVKIKNFGQMDERFFRGARPKERDYPALAALGVKTIIDLTDNSREYEQPAVEAAGLRYINIPMVDKSYPSLDRINEFLKDVNDNVNEKSIVPCAVGQLRTGVVGAVCSFIVDRWNLDLVLAEMDRCDFSSGFGHG